MAVIAAEAGRFLNVLFFFIFAVSDLFASVKKNCTDDWGLIWGQRFVLLAMHSLNYAILYLETENTGLLVFFLCQLAVISVYEALASSLFKDSSAFLRNNMYFFIITGMIMLSRLSEDKAVHQFVIIGTALFLFLPCIYFVSRLWQLSVLHPVYAAAGIFALAAVLLFGNNSFGAQLSLKLWKFSFQPSEPVKLCFAFFVASYLYRDRSKNSIITCTAIALTHVLLLFMSKDLGSAVVFFAGYMAMLFVATGRAGYVFAGVSGACAAGLAAYFLFAHVRNRISAWIDPWSDIENKGYQAAQALFAVCSGGLFGTGLGAGMPYRIPVVEKDFIFAAICEEFGFICAGCLIFVFFACAFFMLRQAASMQAIYFRLLLSGISAMFAVQTFLTAAGSIKLIPSTGVTLPLLSYGGSSAVATILAFYTVQGVVVLKNRDDAMCGKHDENEEETYDFSEE